ncbi:MAG: flagellar basal body P-ring formation chaperone FlgA [Thermodesulfobacteriota bacterium]
MKVFALILGLLVFITADAHAGEITLEERLHDYIAGNGRWPGATIKVENIEVKGDGLKVGEFDNLIVSSRNGAKTTGRVSFNVTLLQGGRSMRTVVAVADVQVLRDVVVAHGPIRMRSEIGPEDVKLSKRDISEIPAKAALSLSGVVGKEARRPIQGGRIVRDDYLVNPMLVKRGQSVEVFGEGGVIVVRSRATAITGGSMGTLIKARTRGGREITGVVSGRAQIAVDLKDRGF